MKDQEGNEITNPNHIGIMNPFRYRSYYYDEETNLYYLNSRYYNPEWGRFLNADGIIGANMDMIGYNLYAYVSNNCTNYAETDGQWSFSLKSVLQAIVSLVDPLGSTRKINRDSFTIKKEQQQPLIVTDAVKKAAQLATNNFVSEAVVVGMGFDIKIGKNITAGRYQDITYKYGDDKISSYIISSDSIKVLNIGILDGKVRKYPISENECGYGMNPYDKRVLQCLETNKTDTSYGNDYIQKSANSIFLGLDFSLYIGLGFHI